MGIDAIILSAGSCGSNVRFAGEGSSYHQIRSPRKTTDTTDQLNPRGLFLLQGSIRDEH